MLTRRNFFQGAAALAMPLLDPVRSLAAELQATLAIGAPWQEMALITPPLLPEEQWAPAYGPKTPTLACRRPFPG
jgi:hypothetical protein